MLRGLYDDMKALGAWAPLRAAYEAARRSGAIGAVLRRAVGRQELPEFVPVPPRWAPPPGSSDLDAARRIIEDGWRIFDTTVVVEPEPPWHADERGGRWPRSEWWKIDLYDEPDRDVKHVWELGRHGHLVRLARAAAAGGDDDLYERTLVRHLTSWVEENPPGVGIHWYSNLELAVRAVAWCEILALSGETLPGDLRREMVRHLYYSGAHIMANLSYTLSSGRNNHLIADAVGLIVIGGSFRDDRRARLWARLGQRLLKWHVRRHVAADGSTIEDAIGYRAFVVQLLAVAIAADPRRKRVRRALERATDHLERAGVGAGVVPHFGDWDGGVAVLEAAGLDPLESAVRTARRVIGSGARTAVTNGTDAGGGLARCTAGDWTVYLKGEAGTSHEHADLTSVAVAWKGRWVVGDPGTGSYNRSIETRNYFRSSLAHDVLRIEGLDQREPHRRFRWKHRSEGRLGRPIDFGEYRVMWAQHDAYRRLEAPATVTRVCLVAASGVVVADFVDRAVRWDLSIPIHPDVSPGDDGESVLVATVAGSERIAIRLPGPHLEVIGSEEPFDGWWADDYDSARPALRLAVRGAGAGPVSWSLSTRTGPLVTVDDHGIVAGALRLAIVPDEHGSLVPRVTPA